MPANLGNNLLVSKLHTDREDAYQLLKIVVKITKRGPETECQHAGLMMDTLLGDAMSPI